MGLLWLTPCALVVAAHAGEHVFTGTSEMRSNPERGFRHELHGACTGEGTGGLPEHDMQQLATYNLTVAQVYCYLPITPTLDSQTILSIETAMGRLRQAGVKALWRFAYDKLNPGENNYTAELVLSHMMQLHDVFNRGIDVVYILQAGWIGSWGEWHGSKNGLEKNKAATQMIVAHELFKLLPPDRKINMRYGLQKAQKVLEVASEDIDDPLAFDVVTAATARSNKAYARIGFDNDALLSDRGDCGTFNGGQGAFPPTTQDSCFFNDCDTRTARTFGPQGSAWSRADLHGPPINISFATPIFDSLHGPMVDPDYAYAQQESPFVPIDGEMDWNTGALTSNTGCNSDKTWPSKVGAESFSWRLRDMHYSTLSLKHGYSLFDGGKYPTYKDNETIDYWMRTPLNLTRLYLDKLPVSRFYAASNRSGYEYIRDHLGYRLELQRAAWPDTLYVGASLAPVSLPFSATLINWGFAAPINPRPVQVVILSQDRKKILWRSTSVADPTEWQPFIPGNPFYTPKRHSFGGNLLLNASRLHCEKPSSNCTLPIGLYLPDARNDNFIAEGVSLAYCIRMANADVHWVSISQEGGVNLLGGLHIQHQESKLSGQSQNLV